MSEFINFIKKHKDLNLLILLLIVNLIVLNISSGGGLINPRQAGFTVISVFQNALHSTGSFFSNTVNSINELKELKKSYDDLQSKIVEYQEIERNIAELTKENSSLREQLGFSKNSTLVNIPAEVIGKDPGNEFNTININKGSRDGIRKDMPVIALQDGYHGLVGKIVEVGLQNSKVLPIYDTSTYVSARLMTARYEGLISGAGNENETLLMNYVKKRAREEIQYNDYVITSGMKSIYPKGIYIGRVIAIEGKEWDTSLQLEIEPIIDFTRLEYVYILNGDTEN